MWFEINDVKNQRFAVAILACQKTCKTVGSAEHGSIEAPGNFASCYGGNFERYRPVDAGFSLLRCVQQMR